MYIKTTTVNETVNLFLERSFVLVILAHGADTTYHIQGLAVKQ